MSVRTPPEYRAGLPPTSSITRNGFSEAFHVLRVSPTNGDRFKLGSSVRINVPSSDLLTKPNQWYIKGRATPFKNGSKHTGTGLSGAVSGASSAIKTLTTSYKGKTWESIQNYNRLCAIEYLNASMEAKISLAKSEYVSGFLNGRLDSQSDRTKELVGASAGSKFFMHKLNFGLGGMDILELALLVGGLDIEARLTNLISEVFPYNADAVDNLEISDVQLVAICTKPSAGYFEDRMKFLEGGGIIERPVQVVRSQTYSPSASNRFTMRIESGVAKSISSVMVVGTNNDLSHRDELSHSDSLGIRTINMEVDGRNLFDTGISYSKDDPESYVLCQRWQHGLSAYSVPSVHLYDKEGFYGSAITPGMADAAYVTATTRDATATKDFPAADTRAVKGWNWQFDLRDTVSSFGEGMTVASGYFNIVLNTQPVIPDATPNIPNLDPSKHTLEAFFVTDCVLRISIAGAELSPVF